MSVKPAAVYDPVAKAFHWGIALLVLIILVTAGFIETPQWLVDDQLRKTIFIIHKTAGFLVLPLTLARLVWRSVQIPPPLPIKKMPLWQVIAAIFTHRSLYVLSILTPLAGWALVSTTHKGLVLFGFIPMPSLPFLHPYMASIDIVRSFFASLHETFAILLASLIVIHIGASFMHHFVDRDDILLRIAPKGMEGFLKKIRGR
ncbi:MAG: cytochrome b [Alphaproteobacteria bacterium]|nr:cytochrome b [Alphaproteobacteria bacterium]